MNLTNSTIPQWWVPESDSTAIGLSLFAMVAWGSWANLLKLNSGVTRFEFFFLDYQLGAFLVSLLLTLLLGTGGFSEGLSVGRFFAAVVAGIVNTLGTLLVMASVELSGMTVVFPVVVGIEMIIGTTFLWLIERKESPGLLFTGVACAMAAVSFDYLSHQEPMEDDGLGGTATRRRRSENNSMSYTTLVVSDGDFSPDLSELSRPYSFSASSSSATRGRRASGGLGTAGRFSCCVTVFDGMAAKSRGLMLCVVAAVFFSLWPVLDALSLKNNESGPTVSASPYAFFLIFRIAALAFTWCISQWMGQLGKRDGDEGGASDMSVTFSNYLYEIPRKSRCLGVTAGFVWGCGTLFSLISGEVVGLGVSVTMTRCSPLVATFWGVVMWNETEGMTARAKLYLIGMVMSYCFAIMFIALAAP